MVQAAWGKGYDTELTRAGIQYAFAQLGLEELAAIAEQSNLASLQVLLKCGFEQVEIYEDAGKTLCRFILPAHR
ncbi:MAG: GNAT family N-acetyltransferase [Chitinophagaceae bacterium]|nr:GNAT family N-acetyltransferase [Chitinophagaceae bacterium]